MKKATMKKSALALLSVLALAACDNTESGGTTEDTKVNYNTVSSANTASLAESVSNYGLGYDEKTEVLGLLEEYIMDNMLGGITLFENGGYQMYKSSITKGSDTYIPGYGLGILSEGSIDVDLAGENNSDWKKYYHTYISYDYTTMNYWDSAYSTPGTFLGHTTGSFWHQEINDTGDGYTYENYLANSPVELVDPTTVNGTAISSTFKFEVKVGEDAKYSTLSQNPAYSVFNDREIVLEDYLTTLQHYHLQSNKLYRGGSSLTAATAISGLQEYYNATANSDGFDATAQTAWEENAGVKASVEDGKSYLEFTLNAPVNEFFAMYYVNSILRAPIPEDFIVAIGGMKNYGTFSEDLSESPVDTSLSTGPYIVSEYKSNSYIVFDQNPNYVHTGRLYTIEGIHYNVLTGLTTDTEAAWKEYNADKLHAVAIPTTQIAAYKDHEDSTPVDGTVTWKLNVNSATQEEWEELFGPNGSIAQNGSDKYWECEPAMNNLNFLYGLFHSINREEYAANRGLTPSANYFADLYMSNPETGASYNKTETHANAISKYVNENAPYGYSLSYAQAYFKLAAQELIESGTYSVGDTIDIEVTWGSEAQITSYGIDLKGYFETAFNTANTGLTLNIINYGVPTGGNLYADKMDVGNFDLAFGAISGTSADPVKFTENLMSSNPNGLIMNYGHDTSVNNGTLVYGGKTWSFDALVYSVNTEMITVANGEVVDATTEYEATAVLKSSLHNGEDEIRELIISIALAEDVQVEKVEIKGYKNGELVTIVFSDLADFSFEDGVMTGSFDESDDNYLKGDVVITITYSNGSNETNSFDLVTKFVK